MPLESKVEKQLCERVVRNFLDVMILSKLEDRGPMSGYDFASFLSEKFGMFLSTGTIYSTLYALEREGFTEGNLQGRKRIYKIVDRGKRFRKAACHALDSIRNVIEEIMKERRS